MICRHSEGHGWWCTCQVEGLDVANQGKDGAPDGGAQVAEAVDLAMDAILLIGKFEANKFGGGEV